ncbi:protein of unknown function [Arsukibacterium tuosuense]|uniref:DUF4434 domain-containing protein n=1 Tax=Arsukibacterium tuosuense TaxID=1323745 RepID=A0A285IM19_9GAMM|nr:protein of unknown function [Arsukibacterium tuosuense]
MVACQSNSSSHGKTVFYQPLNQDRTVSQVQWQQLFEAAANHGYRSLVVQWTRYDNVDFMAQDAQLKKVLQAAEQFNFTIWLGLNSDASYFSQMQQPEDERRRYFKLQLAHNLLQLNRLKKQMLVPAANFAGWYLPVELNDTDFSTQAQISWLAAELRLFKSSVKEAVAVSAFSNGQLSDNEYLGALQQISDTGFHIWLQDDAGVGFKSPARRQALLAQLPCRFAVISEHFRQLTTHELAFQARAASNEEIALAQRAIKGCHAQIVFSLRYLPFAEGVLVYK